MKIKGFLKDVGGASRVTKRRQEAFDAASDKPAYFDPISAVAKALHPGLMEFKLVEVKKASPSSKTLVFSAPHFPYFKPGQCVNLHVKIGDSVLTRPYSITSAPYQTRGEKPQVEITVRRANSGGIVADYLLDKAKVGDVFQGEVGEGIFYYDPIRDAKHVVALAGGSGITPFVSMAKAIAHGDLDFDLTILYGSVDEKDIVLRRDLDACVGEKVHVVHVLSGDNPKWKGETGFITAELIQKYSAEDTTYYVCGPQAMQSFVLGELAKLNVPARRIRIELLAQDSCDITKFEGFPKKLKDKTFQLTVVRGNTETVIPAKATESLVIALERAGLYIHTACRAGACGHCRMKVLEGTYFVRPTVDGRRRADLDFGYVHGCATYPTSDMKVRIIAK